jgi:hypothetical protein
MQPESMTHRSDSRPLSTDELLSALNKKFDENFRASFAVRHEAAQAEKLARLVSGTAATLQLRSGTNAHQKLLAKYIDEIFGDSICALYLGCSALDVPARMLLRRSLELGLVVVAYWDAPAEFFQWRDHDGDIRFSALYADLTRPGYLTYLANLRGGVAVDEKIVFGGLNELYGELSNVVHPKPYNFSTIGNRAYAFDVDTFRKTVKLAEKVYGSILLLLQTRFPDLSADFDGN